MPQDRIETTVQPSYISVGWMHLPKASWRLFPRPGKTVDLEYNGETIKATVELYQREKVRGLRVPPEWLAANFAEKTNLVLTITEPMKKYRVKVAK
jgi:hypothetical protein